MPSTNESFDSTVIADLAKQGAVFLVNHSGGKDSQAMLIKVRSLVPASQIRVVYADLGKMAWEGAKEHAFKYASDLPQYTVKATFADGSAKEFLDVVLKGRMTRAGERKHRFPDPNNRWCTSELKYAPIAKLITQFKREGVRTVVNCLGLRAEESKDRANRAEFSETKSVKGPSGSFTVYEWLPVKYFTEAQVKESIAANGQELHWAYQSGMGRLSCRFCIFSTAQDIKVAAKLAPELLTEISTIERAIGFSFLMPKKGQPAQYLDQIATAQ